MCWTQKTHADCIIFKNQNINYDKLKENYFKCINILIAVFSGHAAFVALLWEVTLLPFSSDLDIQPSATTAWKKKAALPTISPFC